MTRMRGNWTEAKLEYLGNVIPILERLKNYWPLTLRQIYYQLVAAEIIENQINAYRKLSEVLTHARLSGKVPWDALEDRSRIFMESYGYLDKEAIVKNHTRQYLTDYKRDMLTGQDRRLELWVEKDALSQICHDVAKNYRVPVIVARGFSSVSFLHDARVRILQNKKMGQLTRILYFGDLDPSGWAMLPSMMITLQQEMKLMDLVDCERCALDESHVDQYELPHSPEALKENDPRTPAYREIFGDLAVELDALDPEVLESVIEESIENNLNMHLFYEQREIEELETNEIAVLKGEINKAVKIYTDDW